MKVRAIDPSQAQHRRFESGVVLGFMAAAVIAFSLVATTWKWPQIRPRRTSA